MNADGVVVALLVGLATAGLGGVAIMSSRRQVVRAASGRAPTVVAKESAGSRPPAGLGRALEWLAPGADSERGFTGLVFGAAVCIGCVALIAPALATVIVLAVGLAVAIGRHRPSRPVSGSVYEEHLVAALADVEASLVSGASLQQSLALASRRGGPVAADLVEVLGAVRSGQPLQQALDRWGADRPQGGVAQLADALAIAGSTGASQSAAVQAVIVTLRRCRAQAQEVRALASQARASAVVLVVLPIAFAVVISVVDPRVGGFLFASGPGWACLAGGLALDAAGAWWMSLLVRRVR